MNVFGKAPDLTRDFPVRAQGAPAPDLHLDPPALGEASLGGALEALSFLGPAEDAGGAAAGLYRWPSLGVEAEVGDGRVTGLRVWPDRGAGTAFRGRFLAAAGEVAAQRASWDAQLGAPRLVQRRGDAAAHQHIQGETGWELVWGTDGALQQVAVYAPALSPEEMARLAAEEAEGEADAAARRAAHVRRAARVPLFGAMLLSFLLPALFAWHATSRTAALLDRGRKAVGTVESAVPESTRPGSRVDLVWSFADAEGVRHEVRESVSAADAAPLAPGSPVEVTFLPEAPQVHARGTLTARDRYAAWPAALMVGMIFSATLLALAGLAKGLADRARR